MTEYYAQPAEAELRAARDEKSSDLRRSLTGFAVAALALYGEIKYGTGIPGAALILGATSYGIHYGDEWIQDIEEVRFLARRQDEQSLPEAE